MQSRLRMIYRGQRTLHALYSAIAVIFTYIHNVISGYNHYSFHGEQKYILLHKLLQCNINFTVKNCSTLRPFNFRQLHVLDETYVMNCCREDCCYVSLDFDGDLREAEKRGRADNRIARDYVLPDFTNTYVLPSRDTGTYMLKLRLPQDVWCKQCILQVSYKWSS